MSVEFPTLRVRSWADIVALISIIGLAAGGLAWGLKLDNRQNDQEHRIAKAEAAIDGGILPRTDERIRALEKRVESDERDIDRLERDHETKPR